ncbi:MAG: ABC transporter ATP-binding protein [Kiritimatiellae bacterium]|jgi:ABC-type multidrug transport system fused ATPase/permease subunit|nr:ABC transporter ATP-binding protein [Kiritimatiellia bacterium]
MASPPVSNWKLILRLLRFSWQFRSRSIQVIFTQLLILILMLSSLGLTGLAIDFLSDTINQTNQARWPFGLQPSGETEPFRVILIIGGVIGVLALIRALLEYWNQMSVSHLVHVDIVLKLRAQVYEKLQKLSFRFFDKTASGTLINRVTGDVQAVRMFIDQVLIQVFIMVISLIVYLVYMLQMHVTLTLVCLATTPLLWLLSAYFSHRLRPAYLVSREYLDDLILHFSEVIQGIQAVKGFNLEANRAADFEAKNRSILQQRQGIFWLVSTFSPIIGLLTHVNLIILLSYGGYLVVQGELPLGSGLVVFAGILQQFSGQIANIAGVADSVQQSLTGARRVFEILDSEVEVQSPENAVHMEQIRGEIEFDHLYFEYKPQNVILKDIHFSVKPGEVVAIAGATGSGKSALMSLLPRFYDPLKGAIRLDGRDLRSIPLEEIRHNIGIVFQENFLFSNTIANNIAFGHPDASRERIEKAARIACAHEFIIRMDNGYDTILSESGSTLSGGQRQRLAIARAILLEPSILLLDDPTAAIDPETEHEILEAIERAIEGRTTFIVAHRLSTLKRADKVIVLDNGQIIQMGTHDELMAQRGLYRAAVDLQAVDPESLALLSANRRHKAAKEGGVT